LDDLIVVVLYNIDTGSHYTNNISVLMTWCRRNILCYRLIS